MKKYLLKELNLQSVGVEETPKKLVASQVTKAYQLYWEVMESVKNDPNAFRKIETNSEFKNNSHLAEFYEECQTMWQYTGTTEIPIFLVQTVNPQYNGVGGAYNPHGGFMFINLSIFERVTNVQSFERIMIEKREVLCHEMTHSFQGLTPQVLEGRTQDEYYSFWWEIEAYMVGQMERFLFGDEPTPNTENEFVEWVDTYCPNKKRLKNHTSLAQYISTCKEMWTALQELGGLWKSFQPKQNTTIAGVCPIKVIEDITWLQTQVARGYHERERKEMATILKTPNYEWEFNPYIDSPHTEGNLIKIKMDYDTYVIDHLIGKTTHDALVYIFQILQIDGGILNLIKLVSMFTQIGIDFDNKEVWDSYFEDYPHELFINNKKMFLV